MAMDWKPDLANWSMYTPWPFSDLFQELGDKVEIFDFEKYNFVTPIIKPEAMDRAELLDRVMNNYRRFYMRKALFSYPWRGTGVRRRYLLGCLKAFLKSGFERKFYDLGRVNYWGPQSKRGSTSSSTRAGPSHPPRSPTGRPRPTAPARPRSAWPRSRRAAAGPSRWRGRRPDGRLRPWPRRTPSGSSAPTR